MMRTRKRFRTHHAPTRHEPLRPHPADVSINAAIAICAIALVSGTARGFSGFGSALIFMPLASSIAAPRLVAAFCWSSISSPPRRCSRMPGGRPTARPPRSWWRARWSACPIGTYFLSRLDPVTTRWIISGFVVRAVAAAAVGLALSRQGPSRRFPSASAASSGFCSGLAQTGGPPIVGYWLGRPIASGDRARQHPAVFRRVGFLFRRELCARPG